MSPTIVTDHGRPFLAVGSPGGSTIITTVLQVLMERLDLGRPLPEAIAAPRATQRNTATTLAEAEFRVSRRAGARAQYGHSSARARRSARSPAIEHLPRPHEAAAAEPVRRGGGSAAVEQP